jgi:hypothetical protein
MLSIPCFFLVFTARENYAVVFALGKLLVLRAAALLLAVSCGPVQSMTVIWEANAEIEGARTAEAQKYAPYEFVAAETYLDKALEEQSYADFQPAIEFGTKARDFALKAKEMSERATTKTPIPKAPLPAGFQQTSPAAPAPVRIVPVPPAGGTEESVPIVVPVPE